MRSRWLMCAAVLGFLFAIQTRGAASPVTYHYTLIADNSGTFVGFNSNIFPSINAGGDVAFEALTRTGVEGIFAGNGQTITTIATNSAGTPFAFFGPGQNAGPSINADATVAFRADLKAGGQGIFAGDGGPISPIVEATAPSFQGLDINVSGTVAFGFDPVTGPSRIVTVHGGTVTPIAETGFLGGTSLNDLGGVAFTALLPGGLSGIFTGSGGPLTAIVLTNLDGPFFAVLAPSINTAGTVAFQAFLAENGISSGSGIFTGNGGPIVRIVDSTGPFEIFDAPSINDASQVAFLGLLDAGGVGIFTGPDPVTDKVIAVGDPLFGSTVGALEFGGGRALNDAGQVAFRAFLADGSVALARAEPGAVPVPEPSSFAELTSGVIAFYFFSRSISRRAADTNPRGHSRMDLHSNRR